MLFVPSRNTSAPLQTANASVNCAFLLSDQDFALPFTEYLDFGKKKISMNSKDNVRELTFNTPGKNFSRLHIEIFFLVFPENGDNLHEMSCPVFWEKKISIINLLSAELAKRVVKVNQFSNEIYEVNRLIRPDKKV